MLILASFFVALTVVRLPTTHRHLQYCALVLWVVDNDVMLEQRSKCCERIVVDLAQGNATCSSCWH